MQNLSDKKSVKVICRFDQLTTTEGQSYNAILVMQCLLAAHIFDNTVLRIKPGLISCKDLAMVVDNSLDNN